jgi:hypothetical protein
MMFQVTSHLDTHLGSPTFYTVGRMLVKKNLSSGPFVWGNSFFFQVEKHRRDPTRIGGTEVKEEAGLAREGDSVTSKNYDVIGNRIRNQETAEPFLLGIIFFNREKRTSIHFRTLPVVFRKYYVRIHLQFPT